MVFAWIFDVGSSFTHRCLCVIFRSLRLFCPSGRLITFLRNLSSCTPIDGSLDDQKSCLKSTERWRCRRRIFPPNAAPCMSFIFKKWRHLEKWSRLSDAIDRVLECAVNGNEHLHVTRRELLSGKHFLAQLQEQEVWIKERALHKCLCAPPTTLMYRFVIRDEAAAMEETIRTEWPRYANFRDLKLELRRLNLK